ARPSTMVVDRAVLPLAIWCSFRDQVEQVSVSVLSLAGNILGPQRRLPGDSERRTIQSLPQGWLFLVDCRIPQKPMDIEEPFSSIAACPVNRIHASILKLVAGK